jgi:asparagine synthase (glutamine-hydrolysing)
MLETTPEDQYESLPMVDRSGHFAITADARIDNRTELIEKLELREYEDRHLTDTKLILSAYKKWGGECAKRLLGAFAFAIYDRRRRRIFISRDHFGVKPIYYYYKPKKVLAFASKVSPIKNINLVGKKVNDKRVGDYIANIFENQSYTFYKGIKRVPPSSKISINRKKLNRSKYYKLSCNVKKSEKYKKEQFMGVLSEAVRCRLRSKNKVASFLSGGIDSSTVSSISKSVLEKEKDKSIVCFSSVYDRFDECDEKKYIKKVTKKINVNSKFVNGDENRPINQSMKILGDEQPFYAPNMGSSIPLYERMQEEGFNIVLNGHGGDEVVSHGQGRIKGLAERGQWLELLHELRANPANSCPSILFLGCISRYGGSSSENSEAWGSRFLTRAAGFAYRQFRSPNKNKSDGQVRWQDVIREDFMNNQSLRDRKREYEERTSVPRGFKGSPEHAHHYEAVSNNFITHGFETLDRMAALHGIEGRYPFWDKRMVEFCLSLPPGSRRKNGWDRYVMRRAMEEHLPKQVVWRTDKTRFGANFREGLRAEKEKIRTSLEDCEHVFQRYLDKESVMRLYKEAIDSESEPSSLRGLFLMWKVIILARWLNDFG